MHPSNRGCRNWHNYYDFVAKLKWSMLIFNKAIDERSSTASTTPRTDSDKTQSTSNTTSKKPGKRKFTIYNCLIFNFWWCFSQLPPPWTFFSLQFLFLRLCAECLLPFIFWLVTSHPCFCSRSLELLPTWHIRLKVSHVMYPICLIALFLKLLIIVFSPYEDFLYKLQ